MLRCEQRIKINNLARYVISHIELFYECVFLKYAAIKKQGAYTMKVKYLKDAPLASAGTVADVLDTHANVLIRHGIAEAYTEPKKKAKPSKKNDTDDSE